jgi:hypothetical protein
LLQLIAVILSPLGEVEGEAKGSEGGGFQHVYELEWLRTESTKDKDIFNNPSNEPKWRRRKKKVKKLDF